MMDITLKVNGEEHALNVPVSRTLLDALRDDLKLTGSKNACNQGACGACTVLLDGTPVNACLVLAVGATGRDIVTIEGLGESGTLSPVQQAFVDTGAIQCGFCMSGMIVSATAILAKIRSRRATKFAAPSPAIYAVAPAMSG